MNNQTENFYRNTFILVDKVLWIFNKKITSSPNKPAAQAAGADPPRLSSTNTPNPPLQ